MTYVEIKQEEFEDVLSRYKWERVYDQFTRENVYMVEHSGVTVRIYSSIVDGVSRKVGTDAIRVVCWDPVSNLPVMSSESRVYRTDGWRYNLVKRIDEAKDHMANMKKCHICGGIMVQRVNRQTGQRFMGCLNWRNHRKTNGGVSGDVKSDSRTVKDVKRIIDNGVRDVSAQKESGDAVCDVSTEKKSDINLKVYEVIGDGSEKLLSTDSFKWGGCLGKGKERWGFEKFNPIQSKVAEVVGYDNNVVVEAKTSTGKTQMGEMFMWKTLEDGKKVIYTSPLKALTREKWDSWGKKFGGAGYKLAIVTGDYRLTDKRIKELNESDIILCTSEMLDHRTRNMQSEKSEWLKDAGLLILDEVQMIGMKDRGDKLEAGLMRFTKINDECRLLLLSGTMPNSTEISEWICGLNGKETVLIKSQWRPVKLNMVYEKYEDGNGYYVDKDNLFSKVMENVKKHDKDKILIFVHSKVDGRKIMSMLEDEGYAVEFHNADLDTDERVHIEESFRSREEGGVRIILATSTLAYGLNLPARIVIIAGMHRGLDEVSELDIIQMAGRSGRMGIDKEGDAIIILPESQEEDLRYKIEHPEDIKSQISDPVIAGFHIIGEVVGRRVRNRDDVYMWYSRTLAAKQNMDIDNDYVDELVDYLLDNNAIKDLGSVDSSEEEKFVETELGKAAVYFYLRPDMLKDLMDNFDVVFDVGVENSDFIATWALSRLRSYEDIIVSKQDKKTIEQYMTATMALGKRFNPCNEGQSKIGMAYLNMLKGIGSKMVKDGESVVNPLAGIQRALTNDVGRIMQAMAYIDAKYTKWGKGLFWNVLGIRLRYGVGPELVELCRLDGIGGTYAKRLWKVGVKKPIDLVVKKKEAVMVLGARYDGIVKKNREVLEMMM